jgi:heme/copper-type cytochrome/quinol oxidase subunit 2
MLYIVGYFLGAVGSTDGAEQVGSAIATMIILPHLVLLVLAVIFNWVGFFLNAKWAAITTGVLYSVSGVVFLMYIVFEIPMIVLSFVSIGKIAKINKLKEADTEI